MADNDQLRLETGWLADTPIDENLFRQFLHNQAGVIETMAKSKSGRTLRREDVFLIDGNGPVPYFNQAIITRPLDDAGDPVLSEIEHFYDASGRFASLLSIWPTPDLAAHGWTLVDHPGFVVRAPTPIPAYARPDVSVRVAADANDLAIAERVLIEGFPLEEAAGQPPGSELPPTLVGSRLVVRVGSAGDEPVAVGMSYVAHGLLNLCGGVTLAGARRRGVWEALVWARLADAPDLPAVAYTTDDSRPGLIRMGFIPITRFTLWVRQF